MPASLAKSSRSCAANAVCAARSLLDSRVGLDGELDRSASCRPPSAGRCIVRAGPGPSIGLPASTLAFGMIAPPGRRRSHDDACMARLDRDEPLRRLDVAAVGRVLVVLVLLFFLRLSPCRPCR